MRMHGLYVGGHDAAENEELLQRHKIRKLIPVAGGVNFKTLKPWILPIEALPMRSVPYDGPNGRFAWRVTKVAEEIVSGLEDGGVLVHCVEGAHRAPFAVCCGLAALTDATPEQIAEHLIRCRKVVEFDDEVLCALRDWVVAKVRREVRRPSTILPLQEVGPL